MSHFVKALAVHRTERSGVTEQDCVTNRLATCFQPRGWRMPAAERL
jgi:hypothetical protein